MNLWSALPAWMQAMLWASFYGSALAVLVLAAQPLLRGRVPARWRMALWLLVLVRLAPLPLPESRWSVFNWLPHQRPPVGAAVVAAAREPRPVRPEAGAPPVEIVRTESPALPGAAAEAASSALPAPPAPQTAGVTQRGESRWAQWLCAVYLGGALAALLRVMLATRSLRRIVRRAEPADDWNMLDVLDAARRTLGIRRKIPLLLTEALTSPALVGFVRPRLLLPREVAARLSADELRLIFLHECAHLRRRDVLLNYVLAAAWACHWFNPLVWLLLPRIRAERELACDEMVLLHTADPAPYGHTLLKLLESATVASAAPASVGIIESRSLFTRRIHMIAAYRRSPAWLSAAAALSVAIVAACTLTSPASQASAPASAAPTVAPALEGAAPRATSTLVVPPVAEDAADPAIDHAQADLARAQSEVARAREDRYRQTRDAEAMVAQLQAQIQDLARISNDPMRNAQLDAAQRQLALAEKRLATLRGGGEVLTAAPATTPPKAGTASGFTSATTVAPSLDSSVAVHTGKDPNQVEMSDTIMTQVIPLSIAGASQMCKELAPLFSRDAVVVVNEGANSIVITDRSARIHKLLEVIDSLDRATAERQVSVAAEPARVTHVFDIHGLIGVPETQAGALNPDQRAASEDLAKTITNHIGPGDKASAFNGNLVVTAPEDTIRQVANLLDELRARESERRKMAEERAAATRGAAK